MDDGRGDDLEPDRVVVAGGLLGATAAEAFPVACGLASTITDQDILDGIQREQVTLQMIRPAEFIELTFVQTMEGTA